MKLVQASLAAVVLVLLAYSAVQPVHGMDDTEAEAEAEAETDSESESELDAGSEAEADAQDDTGGDQVYELESQDVAGEEDAVADAAFEQSQAAEQSQFEQHKQQQVESDEDMGVAQQQEQQSVEGDVQADAEATAAATATSAEQAQQQGDPWTVDGNVLEVGDTRIDTEGLASFKDVVGKHLPAMVEFYVPACGHCQGFAPEYERLAKAFAGQPVLIARVNAARFGKLADEYHVSRVPDIRYFPKGTLEPQEYRRPRALEDLTIFLNDYAGTEVDFLRLRQVHAPSTVSKSRALSKLSQGYCPLH